MAAISRETVRLAVFDPAASQTEIFSLAKAEFLKKDAVLFVTAQTGRAARVQVVRANGVNTAVTVTDTSNGRSLIPLLAEFPIVKGGAVTEMAYYTSAHPALLSPAVTSAGQSYVRTMLDAAAIKEKFGVEPALIADLLALVGDAADGYPGIAGIGAVTARNLLNRYGAIETFPPAVLGENMKLALLFKRLATLRDDAPLFDDVDALRWRGPTADFPRWAERIESPRLIERCEKALQAISGNDRTQSGSQG